MSGARPIRAPSGARYRLKAQNVSKRHSAIRNLSHPLAIGETVVVVRLPTTRPPFIEGRAIIRDIAQARHSYWLEFIGDPCLTERVVHPDLQRDPERALQVLLDIWRAGDAMPNVADFFPDPAPNP